MMLDQKRAAQAYRDVSGLPKGEDKKEFRTRYGVMALKLTALIRSAGLCQAIHFVASRNKDPYNELLKHLAGQLKRVNPGINEIDKKSLTEVIRKAELNEYLHLTREALAVANWYGRLAQSELKVLLTDETGEDDAD